MENDRGEGWILFLTVKFPDRVFDLIPLQSLDQKDETVWSGHTPHQGQQ